MVGLPKKQLALKINHTKRALLKSKSALSTVVTTLIILVISVLLASVVTYFAINVVSTRVQEESLALTKQHIYHNSTALPASPSYSQATLMVINTGGRDIVVDKLAVRGQECTWKDLTTKKVVLFCVTTDSMSSDLPYVGNFNLSATSPTENQVTLGSIKYSFTVASNDLVLRSGCTMMIYVVNPDSITINDIGLTCSITLYTAQAMYYREANVQAVDGSSTQVTPVSEPTSEPGPGYTISNLQAWNDFYAEGDGMAALVITNNRGIDFQIDFSHFTVNGSQIGKGYIAVGAFTVNQDLYYPTIQDGVITVLGHTLSDAGAAQTIPDGQTAIIYVTGISNLLLRDVNDPVDIVFSTNAGQLTRSVLVMGVA